MRRLLKLVVFSIALILPCVSLAAPITSTLDLHIYERFRLTSWDNAISMEDDAEAGRTFTRHKTLVGITWRPAENITGGLTLANEFRYQMIPVDLPFTMHEVFFDQLYARYRLPIEQEISVTVGRQNMMLGEGFIMMDGGPLDGSRSGYFDAIRADWKIRADHTLTAFYCNQREEEQRLPLINDQDQKLIEQPEEGFGLYFTGALSGERAELYAIHKNICRAESYQSELSVTTLGIRAVINLSREFNLTVEPAHQFGEYDDRDHSAWGGYGYLKYAPDWITSYWYLPVSAELGGVYLSGDDLSTPQDEAWDPMFARWPKWGEGYIYSQIRENGVAWWSNFISLYAGVQFQPDRNVRLDLHYHHLLADERRVLDPGLPAVSGIHRGELVIGKLSYRFNELWSGHLYVEGFNPDDFYKQDADSYVWMRTELLFRF